MRSHTPDTASVETTCSRCGSEIVVMAAGEYLSSTDADLDFVLHIRAHEAVLAIKSDSGAYACPTCGHHDRMPPERKFRPAGAST